MIDLEKGNIEIDEALELIRKLDSPSKYRSGDEVKVVECLCGHEFKIGQVVTLLDREKLTWACFGENKIWYLTEEEFTSI